jgi:peptide deformylase
LIEEENNRVEFTLPLAIQLYPSTILRDKNKSIGVFNADLATLAEAMFEIMYETSGVGLAAPQAGP